MKKLYSIFALLAISVVTNAQTVTGGDMETWRTGTSHYGTYPTRTIHAPYAWNGFDSLIIYEGEYVASIPVFGFGNGNDYWPQVFMDAIDFHTGTASAELITVKQDTLGVTGGSMGNYNTNVTIDLTSASYSYFIYGGLPITGRVHSVSAWVQYKYNSGTIADTALMTVTAHKHFGTTDSVVGSSTVQIDSTLGTGWQQVTAYLYYNDEVTTPDTLRITFSSSISGSVDSSTLHVDDVTMSSALLGVETPIMTGELVDIYPNPASTILNIGCNTNESLDFELFAISGQLIANKTIKGRDAIEISNIPSGLYFYNIYNNTKDIVQKGKLSIVH